MSNENTIGGVLGEQRQCDVVMLNSLNHFVPAAKLVQAFNIY